MNVLRCMHLCCVVVDPKVWVDIGCRMFFGLPVVCVWVLHKVVREGRHSCALLGSCWIRKVCWFCSICFPQALSMFLTEPRLLLVHEFHRVVACCVCCMVGRLVVFGWLFGSPSLFVLLLLLEFPVVFGLLSATLFLVVVALVR